MEPLDGPTIPARTITACLDCERALVPGERWRCGLCVVAAKTAIREIRDRPILPSDVARVRERLAR